MTASNQSAIAVFTGKSFDHILQDGGSQSWVLDRKNARRCAFLVCCRSGIDWVEGHEPRSSAFLVGRIDDVVPSPEIAARWLVRISEYARIDVPDVWKSWRNPVRYTDLAELGIDFTTLHFTPMPDRSDPIKANAASVEPEHGLTIAEAKRGLAKTFGVAEDAIEITIRG